MNAEQIAKGLGKYTKTAGAAGYSAICPSHNDKTPSLSVTDGDNGKILIHCHAGCEPLAVIDALKVRNLWPEPVQKPVPAPKRRIVSTYDYIDPDTGEVKLQVVRFEPKDFRQRRPDGKGGWSWSVPASERVLFNLLAVKSSDKLVCIVEGEKDVEALSKIGIVATCNPGGAGKWQDNYTAALAGRDVLILPDNDEPGENHAYVVAKSLHGHAKTVRVLRLPDLPNKGDVSDWIANGGSKRDLAGLYVA